jgi:hypothetical protein
MVFTTVSRPDAAAVSDVVVVWAFASPSLLGWAWESALVLVLA